MAGAAVLAVLLVALLSLPHATAAALPPYALAQDDEPVELVPMKGLGQPPPKLDRDQLEWLRGRRVTSFQRGQTYVVFFWATWSPSCRRTFPLLARLQERHARDRVQVVGISSWRRFGALPVERFLEKRPDLGDFPMARDVRGELARTWSEQVDLSLIPRAVVIDKTGKVAWIGHPFDELGEAVAAIVAGDSDRITTLFLAHVDRLNRAKEPLERLRIALKGEWWEDVPALVDELVAINPARYGHNAWTKYRALVQSGKPEEAAAYGREAVAGLLAECETHLSWLAWYIVDPDAEFDDDARDLELARLAAEQANELARGRDWSTLNTLARVHHWQGDRPEAVRCVKLAMEETFTSEQRKLLESRLAEYESGDEAP